MLFFSCREDRVGARQALQPLPKFQNCLSLATCRKSQKKYRYHVSQAYTLGGAPGKGERKIQVEIVEASGHDSLSCVAKVKAMGQLVHHRSCTYKQWILVPTHTDQHITSHLPDHGCF